MAVNKVIFGGETVIDLTNDTVTPETLAVGVTAHDKSGNAIVGTMQANTGEDLTAVINQQATLISQLETALQNAASGGGGGSVETCTVDYNDWGLWKRVTYVTIRNGNLQQAILENETGEQAAFAITDAVKGSTIVVDTGDTVDPECTNCELLEEIDGIYGVYTYIYKINGNADILA